MEKHVPIIGGNTSIMVKSVPQIECPFCKSLIEPSLLAAFSKTEDGERHFLSLFPCCGGHYFVSCSETGMSLDALSGWKVGMLPTVRPKAFSTVIRSISPSFETIYNEALIAQKQGLLNICGGGYRKALEFLILDYVIYKNPTEAETIRKMGEFGNVVKNYIDNKALMAHLTAASWLGNDQLHFEKKHIGLEIKDLVSFIDDVVSEIELSERIEEKKRLLPDLEKKLNKLHQSTFD